MIRRGRRQLILTILMFQLQSFQRVLLVLSVALTLIFLPALYVAWFRIKEPATRTVGSLATVTA